MTALTTVLQDSDFLTFYASALRARLGQTMYFVGRNHNPPQFHVMIAPLTFLQPAWAWLAWTAISAGVALWVVRVTMKASQAAWTREHRWLLAACVLNAAATQATLRLGQVSWIMAGLVTAAWLAARERRWAAAGVWSGVAVALKPFLLVLLVLAIVRRQWRAAAWMLTTAILVTLGGGLIFGWRNLNDWIQLLRTPPGATYFEHMLNGSVAGFFVRAAVPSWIGGVLGLGVLLVAALRSRRMDEDTAWLLLLVTALLVSPLGHIYYGLVFLGPLVVLAHERRIRLSPWIVALLVFPPLGQRPFDGFLILDLTLGSAYMWALIGLWFTASRPVGHVAPVGREVSSGQLQSPTGVSS